VSRGQQSTTIGEAKNQNSTNFGNAQSSYGDTQGDIGDYKNQLAKYVSGNPYAAGGEYASTVNSGLANESDAGANSLAGELQSQSTRTHMNSAADAATAASAAQQNTRNLSSSLASADQSRINSEAQYNQSALGATATPINAESSLYGTAGTQASSALNTQAGASQTPGFWDTVGDTFAKGLGSAPSNVASIAAGGCWIAATLYDGWGDPRVHLLRAWIFGPFARTFWGNILSRLYTAHGEKIAAFIKHNKFGRRIAQAIFDKALIRAREWK
jgi:hypothetical protein